MTLLNKLLHQLDNPNYRSLDVVGCITQNTIDDVPCHLNTLDTIKMAVDVAFVLKRRVHPMPFLGVIPVNFNFVIGVRYVHLINRHQREALELDQDLYNFIIL